MNLGQMKTALGRYAGVSTADPLTDWINASLHEFEDAHDWPFLKKIATAITTTGNDLVVLPTDCSLVIKARITTEKLPLEYKPRIEFEDSISDPTVQGKPTTYTAVGVTSLILYPIPDAVYTVRFYYNLNLPDLISDTDVPAIPAKFHYTIVEGAAIRALQAESEEERAETARGIFQDSIDRHISKLGGLKQRGEFSQVRDVMEYGTP